MVVLKPLDVDMQIPEILTRLTTEFPELSFAEGKEFCWSPRDKTIYYTTKGLSTNRISWSLLHETAHALLDHRAYQADYELILMEVAAWERAKVVANSLGINIDPEHIQDCLDSYRDWLYKRSICPTCGTKCLQQADYAHYGCFNCHTHWQVTPSRFCRSYRSQKQPAEREPIFV